MFTLMPVKITYMLIKQYCSKFNMAFKMAVNQITHNKQQHIFTSESEQIDSMLTAEDGTPSEAHQDIAIERGVA